MEKHVSHARKILNWLGEASLRLKSQNCNFAKACIEYLGHILMSDGVKPNSNMIKAVLEYPRPTLAKAVKFGLVNYYQNYQRHLKNLAAIAKP